jgi:RNA polymerase sigma factor (TIGR02999 family)
LSEGPPNDVTRILKEWGEGNTDAHDRLMPFVYGELRRLARVYLKNERSDHTLQPTALVHEAFLKLIDQRGINWQNRAHFYGIAARLMRRILVDHARAHSAEKRGGGMPNVEFEEAGIFPQQQRRVDLISLDEALERLAKLDIRKSKVVEMRFFGGLNEDEIAECLSVSRKTVMRDWQMAKLWLYSELSNSNQPN